MRFSAFTLLALVPLLAAAKVAYYAPNANGGSELDIADSSTGLGEPLNASSNTKIIISGQSDASVLTDNGIFAFARALGFDIECFGLHLGGAQTANLGDGKGYTDQLFELRQNYPAGGTCLESLIGGNHFRGWKQNGTQANSGAWFWAVSKEEPVTQSHTIVPDGYNVGRDLIVNASKSISGYSVSVNYVTGLLPAGSNGVNHGISQDGRVALFTVKVA